MLVREGEERDGDIDRRLAVILAAVAGALNSAAFHAVGFFSANMTGNVSAFSDHLATGTLGIAGFFLCVILAFVSGSALSTLLVNAGRRRGIGGIYAYSILLEAVLLAALGWADFLLSGNQRSVVLVLSLSFLMGLQNAVVTRISNARVRTTHVSGMLTDIGIGLGIIIDIIRGAEPDTQAGAVKAKLRLHLETVLSFLVGGVAGVAIYRAAGGMLLIGTALLLFVLSISAALRSRRVAPRVAR